MTKLVNCKNCHECLQGVYDEYGFPVVITKMIISKHTPNGKKGAILRNRQAVV
jgi:hypothetical protein